MLCSPGVAVEADVEAVAVAVAVLFAELAEPGLARLDGSGLHALGH